MKSRYNNRRSLFAVLLLVVMMLQMGYKTFHQHHHAQLLEFSCSDCDHHRVHSGHILAWEGDTDNCPLCQMLVSPYIPAEDVCVPTPIKYNHTSGIVSVSDIKETQWCIISPRGPPSVYCSIVM